MLLTYLVMVTNVNHNPLCFNLTQIQKHICKCVYGLTVISMVHFRPRQIMVLLATASNAWKVMTH